MTNKSKNMSDTDNTKCLFISKSGNIVQSSFADISELPKKCGFKSANGFQKLYKWDVPLSIFGINYDETSGTDTNEYAIWLYGRKAGRTVDINHIAFNFNDPKINKVYGGCIVVCEVVDSESDRGDDGSVPLIHCDLTVENWVQIKKYITNEVCENANTHVEIEDVTINHAIDCDHVPIQAANHIITPNPNLVQQERQHPIGSSNSEHKTKNDYREINGLKVDLNMELTEEEYV